MSNTFHVRIELFTLFDTFHFQCQLRNMFDTYKKKRINEIKLKRLYLYVLKFDDQNVSKF